MSTRRRKAPINRSGSEADAPIDIDAELTRMFEENFERLRAESGHTLSPEVKEAAWLQVRMYWRKLRQIAESVTDTEVLLNLPNQSTPGGRRFSIEGVVDIVRKAGCTTMYDIKTHDLDYVRANRDLYEEQLNVYAHIWQHLRGERLDEMAVISTPVPPQVQETLRADDPERLTHALSNWDPVVPVAFAPDRVAETIRKFGEVVDRIEDGEFAPPAAQRLRRHEAKGKDFGRWVCQNCDARFSCAAYRDYAKAPSRKNAASFQTFFDTIADEDEREAWREAAIPAPEIPDE